MSLEGRWLEPSLICKHLGESPPGIGESRTAEGSALMAEKLVIVGVQVPSRLTEGDGLDTGVVRLLCNLAGHEGLPDSAISSSFPKSASLRSLMASTILASIFCTEGLNLTGNALCDKNSVTCFNNIGVRWIRG